MIQRIENMAEESDDSLEAVGGSFYREGKLPGGFDVRVFRATWEKLISAKLGALWKLVEGDTVIGGLGGTMFPCPNDGALVAHEMFWYVAPEHRGGMGGARLLKEFEGWAEKAGAKRVQMAHLIGLAPERMKEFYEKRGYRAVEITYMKEF